MINTGKTVAGYLKNRYSFIDNIHMDRKIEVFLSKKTEEFENIAKTIYTEFDKIWSIEEEK